MIIPTVAIFTEGGNDLGYGHIVRSLSLASSFQERGIEPRLIVHGDDTIKGVLRGVRYELLNWHEEVHGLLQGMHIGVVDSRDEDKSFYHRLSNAVDLPLYFDDELRDSYPRGIIVNAAIGAAKLHWPMKKEPLQYLLDAQYVPLRKPFWDVTPGDIREDIRCIFVSFGGNDFRDMTSRILRWLKETHPSIEKIVLLSSGFQHRSAVEELCDEKTTLLLDAGVDKIIAAMRRADLAITAAGQTLYELARLGIPTISIQVSQNQIYNIQGWTNAGFIKHAGAWDDECLFNSLQHNIKHVEPSHVRKQMAQAGVAAVDGHGAQRIVTVALKCFYANRLFVRRAVSDDMMKVLQLSNEEAVRRSSFRSGVIDIETHQQWFSKKLLDPECLFFVAEIDGCLVGQIRFEIKGDNADISISMSSAFRGFGLGDVFMERTFNELRKKFPHVVRVTAYVRNDNQNSNRFFQKAGFDFHHLTRINAMPASQYIYSLHKEVS